MNITFSQVAKFVWSYLRARPWWLLCVFTLVVLKTAAELAMPYLFGIFTDFLTANAASPAEAGKGVAKILALIAITGVSFWILDKGKNIFWDWRWLPMLKKIQLDAFYKVQRFSTDWHVNSFAGATMRKITRGVWASNSFADQFLFGFIPLSLLVIGMIIMMFLRWNLIGIILAAGSIFYLIFSIWVVRRFVAPRAKSATRTDTKIGAQLADSVSCNSTVKIFGRENSAKNYFETLFISVSFSDSL